MIMKDSATVWSKDKAERAKKLCADFLSAPPSRRFIFGRNIYTTAVTAQVQVAAIVDDFTQDGESQGVPIIRSSDLPADAIVLAASGGRPLTIRKLLAERGIANLDYFTLLQWSGLPLPDAVFNEGFRALYDASHEQIAWLDALMADNESRQTLRKLLAFRYSYDLDCLNGFTERQTEQYFEPFLNLQGGEPVFVDVGGFDGFTAEEFIKRSPNYKAVYVFEPEVSNYEKCRERLAHYPNIHLLPYGAGAENETLRFSSAGSASSICENGETEIQIRRIDDVVNDMPTFIKMDIEGVELSALEGARQSITKHRPTLAICVYHRPSDFWMVPRAVLSMSPDYLVYLRHYTESIYETVMYFVPR
jgi:FkbM family methyltransferase